MPTIRGGAGYEYAVGFDRSKRKKQVDGCRIWAKYMNRFLTKNGMNADYNFWSTYITNKEFLTPWMDVFEIGIKQSIVKIKTDRKPAHARTHIPRKNGIFLHQLYEKVHGEQYKVDDDVGVWSESHSAWIASEIFEKEIRNDGIWYLVHYKYDATQKWVKMDSNEIKRRELNDDVIDLSKTKRPRKAYATRCVPPGFYKKK